MSRFSDLLKRQFSSESRSDRRTARVGFLDYCKFEKIAQEEQHGILQHFRSENRGYPTRDQYHTMRGVPSEPSPGQTPSDGSEMSRLYGVNPEHKDSEILEMNRSRALSTRYSPDRVGVQARRVSDGVWQDPYTNRTYDYNDGFTTESGEMVPGGHVALQSHMIGMASHLDSVGLYKEADYLDALIKKAGFFSSRNEEDVISHEELRTLHKLYAQKNGIELSLDEDPPKEVTDAFIGLDKKSPLVRELLGLDSGEAVMYEPEGFGSEQERRISERRKQQRATIEHMQAWDRGETPPIDWDKVEKDRVSRISNRPPAKGFLDWDKPVGEPKGVDYRAAVASAIQVLRGISRSASIMNRRDAYELMEVVFEGLAGEEAVQALSAERSIIDQESEEGGSGRGFLG